MKKIKFINVNLLGEGFSIFTYSYLCSRASVQSEAKGLMTDFIIKAIILLEAFK